MFIVYDISFGVEVKESFLSWKNHENVLIVMCDVLIVWRVRFLGGNVVCDVMMTFRSENSGVGRSCFVFHESAGKLKSEKNH